MVRDKDFGAENGNDKNTSSRKYFRESKYPSLGNSFLVCLLKMESLNIPFDGNAHKEK